MIKPIIVSALRPFFKPLLFIHIVLGAIITHLEESESYGEYRSRLKGEKAIRDWKEWRKTNVICPKTARSVGRSKTFHKAQEINERKMGGTLNG